MTIEDVLSLTGAAVLVVLAACLLLLMVLVTYRLVSLLLGKP